MLPMIARRSLCHAGLNRFTSAMKAEGDNCRLLDARYASQGMRDFRGPDAMGGAQSLLSVRNQFNIHAVHGARNLAASRRQELVLDGDPDRPEVAGVAIALGADSQHSRQVIPVLTVGLDDAGVRWLSLRAFPFLLSAAGSFRRIARKADYSGPGIWHLAGNDHDWNAVHRWWELLSYRFQRPESRVNMNSDSWGPIVIDVAVIDTVYPVQIDPLVLIPFDCRGDCRIVVGVGARVAQFRAGTVAAPHIGA
jgi:hypothetical protein